MKNMMEYKGYYGTVEYSPEDALLFGKVQGVNASITYEGESLAELRQDFEDGLNHYLAYCQENGVDPSKTYRGKFNVRIDPELHRLLALSAESQHISLNSAVEQAIAHYVQAQ